MRMGQPRSEIGIGRWRGLCMLVVITTLLASATCSIEPIQGGETAVTVPGAKPKAKGSLCDLPFEVGPCRAAFQVYTYSKDAGGCIEQIYGGCLGNANRFDRKDLCEMACYPKSGNDFPAK